MYLFSDFGDLPVMIVGGDVAAQVEIFGAAPDFGATGEAIIGGDGGSGHTPTKGTKENVPCSRRGFCDTLTGKGGRVVVRCCALLCMCVHVANVHVSQMLHVSHVSHVLHVLHVCY